MNNITQQNKGEAARTRTRSKIFRLLQERNEQGKTLSLSMMEIASGTGLSVSTVLRFKADIAWFVAKQAPAAVVEEPSLIHQLRLISDSGLPAAEVCQKAVVALVNLDDLLTRERQVNEELRARLSAINVAATDYTPSWPDHVVQKALHARAVLNLRK